ncbi:MAG: Hsp20/alpha crystallin family protein [Candidatus Binatia bacterium]
MKKEDFNLEVNDRTLPLSCERKAESLTDAVEYRRAERVKGKFCPLFYLPRTVLQNNFKASHQAGILGIQVPKAEEAKPKPPIAIIML